MAHFAPLRSALFRKKNIGQLGFVLLFLVNLSFAYKEALDEYL
jgi:hypothetical protein